MSKRQVRVKENSKVHRDLLQEFPLEKERKTQNKKATGSICSCSHRPMEVCWRARVGWHSPLCLVRAKLSISLQAVFYPLPRLPPFIEATLASMFTPSTPSTIRLHSRKSLPSKRRWLQENTPVTVWPARPTATGNFSADLCRSCLMDLGSDDLREWGRLQSSAVDSLTSVSGYFIHERNEESNGSKEITEFGFRKTCK